MEKDIRPNSLYGVLNILFRKIINYVFLMFLIFKKLNIFLTL